MHKGGIGLYSKGLYEALKKVSDKDIHIEKIEVDHKNKTVKVGDKTHFVKSFFGINDIFYAYFALKKLKIRDKYDLFYFSTQSLSFLPFNPKVLTCHDLTNIITPATFLARITGRIYGSGLKKCQRLITVSDFTKKDLMNKYSISSDLISTIYQGIGSGFQVLDKSKVELKKEKGLNIDTRYILYVGSEEKRKNFKNIVKALKIVKDTFNEKVELLKIGKVGVKGTRKETLDIISELGIKESVHFLEEQSFNDLVKYLNLSELLVFPSFYEGFGRTPLEAMACGLPVVSSNLTSIPEVVGDAAHLVDAYSEKSIAEGIIRVLSDDVYKDNLIKLGYVNLKKFAWERIAEEVIKVFKVAIDG